ncbi:unnamed protein product, partial [Meganyctiphanes norvegica]
TYFFFLVLEAGDLVFVLSFQLGFNIARMLSPYTLSLCAFSLFIVGIDCGDNVKFLLIPNDATKCANRPKHWENFHLDTNGEKLLDTNGEPVKHAYFYSNDVKEFKGKKYDWLDARNLCRQYCMDAVSIESFEENQRIFSFIDQRGVKSGDHSFANSSVRWRDDRKCGPGNPVPETGLPAQCNPDSDHHCCNAQGECKDNSFYWDCGCLDCIDYKDPINYLWTSGRLCDFTGCEARYDLLPLIVNGWFWSGSNAAIPPTNNIPEGWDYQPWGPTGHKGLPQPDNAELDVNGTPESCLAVSKNLYQDGVQWHDIGCYHRKTVICEDSDDLLDALNVQDEGEIVY